MELKTQKTVTLAALVAACVVCSTGCVLLGWKSTSITITGISQNPKVSSSQEATTDIEDALKDLLEVGDIAYTPGEGISALSRSGDTNAAATGPGDGQPDPVTPPDPGAGDGQQYGDRYAGDYPEGWVIVADGPALFSRGGYPVPQSRFRGREDETYVKPSSDKILLPWHFVKYGSRWWIATAEGVVDLSNTTRFVPAGNVEALPNDGRVHLHKSGMHRLSGILMMEDIDGGTWSSGQMNFGDKATHWGFSQND